MDKKKLADAAAMADSALPDVVQMAMKRSSSGPHRHRYQPSRGSSASIEERGFILQQLEATFSSLDESQIKHLLNRMEFRVIEPGKTICTQGEATAPCLYVVLSGNVNVTQQPEGSRDNNGSATKVFGKELLERAEFRKTGGGKVVSSLVTAPYSVSSDPEGGCRLAVLVAVAYREVLKLDNDQDEEVDKSEEGTETERGEEEDQSATKGETRKEDGNKAFAKAEPKDKSDDDSLEGDQLFDPPQLEAVGETEETEHTEVSAAEGAYVVEVETDSAGRRVAATNVRRLFIPPANVTQERIEDEAIAKFVRPEYEKPKKDQKQIKTAMEANPLLTSLPKKTVKHVTAAMKKSKAKAGQLLIEDEADQDRYYCVVSEGECDFGVRGFGDNNRFVGRAGFTFGEEALTCPSSNHGTPLKHGVTAKTDCEFYKVEHNTYRKLVAKDNHEERASKLKALEKVSFVEVMAYDHLHVSFLESLSLDNREKLLDIMHEKEFARGDVIVSKEESKDTFLIVTDGQVECRNMSSELHSSMEDITLGVGKHFGDQVLCQDIKYPRMAEVVGKSKTGAVYTVSRDEMAALIGKPLNLIPVDVRALGAIEALRIDPKKDLSRDHLLQITHRIKNKTFKAGTVIVEADQETDACIYIVRQGNASFTKGRIKKGLLPGNHFGEDLFVQCRETNVSSGISKLKLEAQTTCIMGIITLDDYFEAINHAEEFASLWATNKTKKPSKKTSSKKTSGKQPNWPKCDVKLPDLERCTCLGEGNFGQIWLVRDKSEGQELATKPCVLKIQSKHHLLAMKQVKVAIEEKQTLQRLHHPFIVDLINAYQDDGFLYMLLEFLPGGELYSILSPPEGPAILPEPLAKFYALCVADALAYMHSRNIVYRDLKPENVLIDRQGFPKLIDFGFAKIIDGPTYTLCGTPGYIAPEVVLNVGHGKSYDHWQLGILVYDMLSYDSPFFDPDDDDQELYRKVVEDPVPKIIGEVSPEVWDLILGLLVKDPKQRLGSLKRCDRDILRHEWFREICLSELREKKVQPPWIPEMAEDPFDTSNYEDFSEIVDMTTEDLFSNLEPDQAEVFVKFND